MSKLHVLLIRQHLIAVRHVDGVLDALQSRARVQQQANDLFMPSDGRGHDGREISAVDRPLGDEIDVCWWA